MVCCVASDLSWEVLSAFVQLVKLFWSFNDSHSWQLFLLGVHLHHGCQISNMGFDNFVADIFAQKFYCMFKAHESHKV